MDLNITETVKKLTNDNVKEDNAIELEIFKNLTKCIVENVSHNVFNIYCESILPFNYKNLIAL